MEIWPTLQRRWRNSTNRLDLPLNAQRLQASGVGAWMPVINQQMTTRDGCTRKKIGSLRIRQKTLGAINDDGAK